MNRDPLLRILMVIFGVILLAPGVCAIFFMTTDGLDPAIVTLWVISFLISAGGVWLLVRAFR